MDPKEVVVQDAGVIFPASVRPVTNGRWIPLQNDGVAQGRVTKVRQAIAKLHSAGHDSRSPAGGPGSGSGIIFRQFDT